MVNRRMFNATIGDAIVKKRSKWKPLLSTVPILREVSDYDQALVADAVQLREFPDGATVTKPHAPLLFYIVFEGQVECPSAKRTFGRGDFFGQAEILQDKAASQPVRKTKGGRASFLTLTPAQFYQLIPLNALVKDSHEQADTVAASGGPRSRRHGVGAEATSSTKGGGPKTLPVGTAKSKEQIERIRGAVKQNIIFSRLNEQQLTVCCALRRQPPGTSRRRACGGRSRGIGSSAPCEAAPHALGPCVSCRCCTRR
jgi:hypothetical protein